MGDNSHRGSYGNFFEFHSDSLYDYCSAPIFDPRFGVLIRMLRGVLNQRRHLLGV